ncbi:DNA-binding transcriptional LysR family regulator [Acinetobacter calcoaceticus]|uniref:DNA-binding transcriptional LysR family regulator n=1 Tax=Acinetobacter calcoaceticus TaxID=471 RepID=A0A4R1XIQ9_ACICA|nr:DNA-binding transcriptional LysR family regulator [Acinetobacter calcoaceticus]
MMDKLNLKGLRFFHFVAQYGTISLAAEKLCITQGAVSKQILNLEQGLGLDLFIRAQKKMILTEHGRQLYDCTQSIFQHLAQCLTQLQQADQKQANLVLSCEPTIAMKWLIPRLADFHHQYPDIEINLRTAGGPVDWHTQGIDLALRRNDFKIEQHLYAEKIADEYMCCVAKPAPNPAITSMYISSSRPDIWKTFIGYQQTDPQAIKALATVKPKQLEHFYLCLEACLAGLGASICSIYMIEKELEYLILQPLSQIYTDQTSYLLISATPFEQDQRKQCFKHWLSAQMQQTQHRVFLKHQVSS